MRTRKQNNEVFYAEDLVIQARSADIQWLKKQAGGNLRERARLCTHRNTEDLLHEMFIVHARDTYIRPHKHLGKPESFHVIEGTVDVIVFEEDGSVRAVIKMGEYLSGRPFYYRISDPLYHTLIIRSDVLVFHETTSGPFNRADTIFAPWAPEENNPAACGVFMGKLLLSAGKKNKQEKKKS